MEVCGLLPLYLAITHDKARKPLRGEVDRTQG